MKQIFWVFNSTKIVLTQANFAIYKYIWSTDLKVTNQDCESENKKLAFINLLGKLRELQNYVWFFQSWTNTDFCSFEICGKALKKHEIPNISITKVWSGNKRKQNVFFYFTYKHQSPGKSFFKQIFLVLTLSP